MKTILVDAIHCFVSPQGVINSDMHVLLETYNNKKIILTGADDVQFKNFGLDKMPYEVFTLKHDPEKTNPEYFHKLLLHFNLKAEDVIYFEHDQSAVASAQSVGIKTHHYDSEKKDLRALEDFLNKENTPTTFE